jgi:hypothetical protein
MMLTPRNVKTSGCEGEPVLLPRGLLVKRAPHRQPQIVEKIDDCREKN